MFKSNWIGKLTETCHRKDSSNINPFIGAIIRNGLLYLSVIGFNVKTLCLLKWLERQTLPH